MELIWSYFIQSSYGVTGLLSAPASDLLRIKKTWQKWCNDGVRLRNKSIQCVGLYKHILTNKIHSYSVLCYCVDTCMCINAHGHGNTGTQVNAQPFSSALLPARPDREYLKLDYRAPQDNKYVASLIINGTCERIYAACRQRCLLHTSAPRFPLACWEQHGALTHPVSTTSLAATTIILPFSDPHCNGSRD